jgi:hypothetical protein
MNEFTSCLSLLYHSINTLVFTSKHRDHPYIKGEITKHQDDFTRYINRIKAKIWMSVYLNMIHLGLKTSMIVRTLYAYSINIAMHN